MQLFFRKITNSEYRTKFGKIGSKPFDLIDSTSSKLTHPDDDLKYIITIVNFIKEWALHNVVNIFLATQALFQLLKQQLWRMNMEKVRIQDKHL